MLPVIDRNQNMEICKAICFWPAQSTAHIFWRQNLISAREICEQEHPGNYITNVYYRFSMFRNHDFVKHYFCSVRPLRIIVVFPASKESNSEMGANDYNHIFFFFFFSFLCFLNCFQCLNKSMSYYGNITGSHFINY